MLYELLLQNKEIIKIFYALAVIFICFLIVIKSNKIFKLSFHQGIRYFRNAFLFYALGFFFRYIVGTQFLSSYFGNFYPLTGILFEFFLVMGGFFLLYSLVWKYFESPEKSEHSSLLNSKIFIFYLMAILFVSLDYFWKTYFFMFLSQIILFFFLSFFSYKNFKKTGFRKKFPKFYFIAMLLSLITWVLNSLLELFFHWNKSIVISVYLINVVVFFIFLYGVIKSTK